MPLPTRAAVGAALLGFEPASHRPKQLMFERLQIEDHRPGPACGRNVEVPVFSTEPRMAMAVNVRPKRIRLKELGKRTAPDLRVPKARIENAKRWTVGHRDRCCVKRTLAGRQDQLGCRRRAFRRHSLYQPLEVQHRRQRRPSCAFTHRAAWWVSSIDDRERVAGCDRLLRTTRQLRRLPSGCCDTPSFRWHVRCGGPSRSGCINISA